MIVSELIKILSLAPQDAEVLMDNDWRFSPIESVDIQPRSVYLLLGDR